MRDAIAAHVHDGDTVVIEGFTHLICFAAGHHLVVDEIGRQPGQREIALALANDLVTGRETDEVGEALDGDRVAVMHELGDGITHRGDLGRAHGTAGITPWRLPRRRPLRTAAAQYPLRPR